MHQQHVAFPSIKYSGEWGTVHSAQT